MDPLVGQKREAVAALCRRFSVRRLYLFGSATTQCFDPERSDLDFLVAMSDRRPTGSYADRVLGLAEGLEQLFGRHVDLVTEESVRNPYFRLELEAKRQLVYERPDQEAVA